MRNILIAAMATLAVVFSGPVRSDIPAPGHHGPAVPAIVNDFGGLG